MGRMLDWSATIKSKVLLMGERMNNVQLSIDKVAIEYHEVRVNFYNKLALSFRDWFDIRPVIRHKGNVYHWKDLPLVL